MAPETLLYPNSLMPLPEERQKPTCDNVRIRSTQDAHAIFHAVDEGILPMIARRLDAEERLSLESGHCYVWEERGANNADGDVPGGLGIERFTEGGVLKPRVHNYRSTDSRLIGRNWGPSRVRDEFLFYYEQPQKPNNRGKKKKAKATTPESASGSASPEPEQDGPSLETTRYGGRVNSTASDPLVKQTYSVYVERPGRPKWHLTAYFTQSTVDELGTIDDIPHVASLVVPEDRYKSTRTGRNAKRKVAMAEKAKAKAVALAEAEEKAKNIRVFPGHPAATALPPHQQPRTRASLPANSLPPAPPPGQGGLYTYPPPAPPLPGTTPAGKDGDDSCIKYYNRPQPSLDHVGPKEHQVASPPPNGNAQGSSSTLPSVASILNAAADPPGGPSGSPYPTPSVVGSSEPSFNLPPVTGPSGSPFALPPMPGPSHMLPPMRTLVGTGLVPLHILQQAAAQGKAASAALLKRKQSGNSFSPSFAGDIDSERISPNSKKRAPPSEEPESCTKRTRVERETGARRAITTN